MQIGGHQIRNGELTNVHIASGAGIDSAKLANWGANRNAGGFRLVNLANAVDPTDAPTLQQVNSLISNSSSVGLTVKDPVRLASTVNISASYGAEDGPENNGQFTGAPNTLDGESLVQGDRILLKNQNNQDENGIYVVTTLGTGSDGVWDRADDFNSDEEVLQNSFVFVQEGSVNTGSQWVMVSEPPIEVGGITGSYLVFTQFSASASYTADEASLTLVGSQFSVKDGGIISSKILDGSVTEDKIAAGAISTDKILNNAVTADKIASNAVTETKILNGAVTENKLAANSVTSVKIANDAITGGKIKWLARTVSESPDGTRDTFTLSAPADPDSLIVWINGLKQDLGTHFTLDGDEITFLPVAPTFSVPLTNDLISVFGIEA